MLSVLVWVPVSKFPLIFSCKFSTKYLEQRKHIVNISNIAEMRGKNAK